MFASKEWLAARGSLVSAALALVIAGVQMMTTAASVMGYVMLILAAILVVLTLGQWWVLGRVTGWGRVYPTRRLMEKRRGGISTELAHSEEVWAMWLGGTNIPQFIDAKDPRCLGRDGKLKLTRLILRAPTSPGLELHAEAVQRKRDALADEIRRAIAYVVSHGTTVFLRDGEVACVTIGFYGRKRTPWARLEVPLPGVPSSEWPNVLLSGATAVTMVQTFERWWFELEKAHAAKTTPTTERQS